MKRGPQQARMEDYAGARAMKELPQEMLGEIVRRIVEAVQPVEIYLFGSHASGRPNKDSDVDLLVVVDGMDAPRHKLAVEARRSLRGMCIPVDIIVRTTADMAKWTAVPCNLLHTVAEKGRRVYVAAG